MNLTKLKELLTAFKKGDISEKDILDNLKNLPFESLDFAHVDHHRFLRKGFPEIIFCQGKTSDQIAHIAVEIVKGGNPMLASRATTNNYIAVRKLIPEAVFHESARIIGVKGKPEIQVEKKGSVLIITAGTSDIPVADEAGITLEYMNHHVSRLFDVGVAGIHRLFYHLKDVNKADVIIVVAGMEGALASVVGGVVDKPIIAVPTSIGYGASFNGLAALLGMLNSCATGVTVVNIDNGIGAAYAASIILRQIYKAD